MDTSDVGLQLSRLILQNQKELARLTLQNQKEMIEGILWLGKAPGVVLHNQKELALQRDKCARMIDYLEKDLGI